MEEQTVRINKYLSAAGVCSRREADRQIEAGNIRIGEKTACIGDLVKPGDAVYVQGRLVETEKEYLVTVHKTVTDEFLRALAGGVPILGTMTRKCKVERTGQRSFRMILTQGLNRQIRRMCEYFDYRVVSLKRVRIMNIHLGDLPVGKYRMVTDKERKRLEQMLEGSSDDTVYFESSAAAQQLWEEEQ